MNDATDKHKPETVEAFIDRWTDTGGKERANYQLFLTELCQLLISRQSENLLEC